MLQIEYEYRLRSDIFVQDIFRPLHCLNIGDPEFITHFRFSSSLLPLSSLFLPMFPKAAVFPAESLQHSAAGEGEGCIVRLCGEKVLEEGSSGQAEKEV
jgi:hypothetical protein